MDIGGFGFGLPHGLFGAMGFQVTDVTLPPSPPHPPIADFIEPFMDPFCASVLHRLAAGTLNHLAALIFMRESPGAVHAFHYACEFERRGALPADAPRLILFNLIPVASSAADPFNQSEIARVKAELAQAECAPSPPKHPAPATALQSLEQAQAGGQISGADAFDLRAAIADSPIIAPAVQPPASSPPKSPRIALLGTPFGNSALHGLLDQIGTLAIDQQALDQTRAAAGDDFQTALAAQSANPYAARQPRDVFADTISETIFSQSIEQVVWQVDTHDDLWGWLAPDVHAASKRAGAGFIDLGHLPRWPKETCLTHVKERLFAEVAQ